MNDPTDNPTPTCSECVKLRQEIEVLKAIVHELQQRLNRNSSNSSIPPSANPLNAPKRLPRNPTGRKQGGQPGHRGHHRLQLPPERVTEVVEYIPEKCSDCQAPLPKEVALDHPEPRRHQGGRFDVDSNLYHFRHRDYSAPLGRWTRNDPIGFEAGDTNLYRYVGNGPLNGVDSWGLREIPEVGMGSGRGGLKNPGRPGNPNGRPVSTDNEWMDEFIFYDYWYYLTHPLEGSTGMVVAKGGLAVTALGTGSLACGLALSGSAATGAITKTTFIGTGGTHFIVKIGEKAYEGLGQKGAIRIFPLRPYEFPRTTYWNTITFPLTYPQRGIEYAEKAGVTTYNCLSAAVKIVLKAF